MQFRGQAKVWVAFALALAGAAACGSDRPALLNDESRPAVTTQGADACAQPGAVRVCKRLISQHDNVVTCAFGTQSCADGMWSECGGPAQSIAMFQRGHLNASLPPQFLSTDRPGAGAIPAPEVLRLSGTPRTTSATNAPTATGARVSREAR